MNQIRHSLSKQFYWTILTTVFIIIFSAFSYNIYSSHQYNKQVFIDESKLQTEFISDNLVDFLMFEDIDSIQSRLYLLNKYESIEQIIVYDKQHHIVASYSPHANNIKLPKLIQNQNFLFFNAIESEYSNILSDDYLVYKKFITLNSVKYGEIILVKNTTNLKSILLKTILNSLIFIIILLLIIVFNIYKISSKFIAPIVELSTSIARLSSTHDYSLRLTVKESNEIGQLYTSFNQLFSSIQEHEKRLKKFTITLEEKVLERTQELNTSLSNLRKTQNQLVESEKMAALGTLVSGVAHEINTPLGNALTGSSILKADAKTLLAMLQNNAIKKSILEETLSSIQETSSLVQNSISRAAKLVQSFKQISVDQSLEEIRKFNIYEYFNEIVLTFKSKLKQVKAEVIFTGDQEIILKSYAGVFAQILNNLIQNSIMHGFEHKKSDAKIYIDLKLQEDTLKFIYKDNGSGIDENIIDKAFDPFVTTKRNEGGTGLGLNILYNIVTQKLKGTVTLQSKKNEGVTFLISVPINL